MRPTGWAKVKTEAAEATSAADAQAMVSGLLAAACVDEPRLEAGLLVAFVMGRDRTYLAGHPEHRLAANEAKRVIELARRRASREPLSYILGRRPFLDMVLEVGPGVLIPRPETEILVEAAAARLAPGAEVLEIGAGSGCVALGLARTVSAHVTTLEISPEALAAARRNIEQWCEGGRIELVAGAFPEDLPPGRQWDAIVSNPPYIPSGELAGLEPEVRDWEPRIALDGGPDGLSLIRIICAQAPALLRRPGLLALEVAQGQAAHVIELMRQAGAGSVEALPDLGGIDRVVAGRFRSAGG